MQITKQQQPKHDGSRLANHLVKPHALTQVRQLERIRFTNGLNVLTIVTTALGML